MDDIHSPSIAVARANQSAAPPTGNDGSAEALFELIREKDRVEAELKALGAVLDSVELLLHRIRPLLVTHHLTNSAVLSTVST
jgi:hypothetical protein